MEFYNQLKMNGAVNCSCGGTIISNSGKVCMENYHYLRCWKCNTKVDLNCAYSQRRENEVIIFNRGNK